MADATAALAAAIATVVPTVVAPTSQAAGAPAAQQAVEVAQAAGPPQPIAGLVPARLDGTGGVAPVVAAPAAATPPATATPVAGPVPTLATATVATTVQPDSTTTADAAVVAPAPATAQAPAGSTTAPAATLTLTIGTASSGTTDGGLEQDAQPQVPAGQVATPAPAADKALPAPMRPQVQDAAPAAATSPDAPAAGSIAPAPAQPLTHADPLGGIVRSGGGLTTPHELARELGTRVHMAVREGGRELVLNLRPADLGHLTIRVTMHDGIMQAQIIADRPEAARMLQQSMQHLGSALGDLGYSLDNLDVAYQGQDPRDAQASSEGGDDAVAGEVLEADGTPAVSGTTTSTGPDAPGRLDILA